MPPTPRLKPPTPQSYPPQSYASPHASPPPQGYASPPLQGYPPPPAPSAPPSSQYSEPGQYRPDSQPLSADEVRPRPCAAAPR